MRWVLILAAIGLVAAALFWLPLSGAIRLGSFGSGGTRSATATVLTTAPCGGTDARDQVEVKMSDGRARRAKLEACGHREGEVLDVDVPVNEPKDELIVQIAGTGPGNLPSLEQRLSVVLLALSGVSGATYAFLIRPRRPR